MFLLGKLRLDIPRSFVDEEHADTIYICLESAVQRLSMFSPIKPYGLQTLRA